MVPRGVPVGLDADSAKRVERSFLVVRIVRSSLLLVFLALTVVAVQVRDWPTGVAVAVAVTLLLQAGALMSCIRRYRMQSSEQESSTGHGS